MANDLMYAQYAEHLRKAKEQDEAKSKEKTFTRS